MSLTLNDILDMPTNTPEPTPEPKSKLKLHGSLQDCAAKVAPKPAKTGKCPRCDGAKTEYHRGLDAMIECPRCAGKGFVTGDDVQRKKRYDYIKASGKKRTHTAADYIIDTYC